jgi:hypothetical protein
MVEIGSVGSIWYQIASFSFLIVAFVRNFIQLRVCVIVGNLLFILNASLGWPFWPNIVRDPLVIAPDTMVWASLVIIFTVVSLISEMKTLKIHNSKAFFSLLFQVKKASIHDLIPDIEIEI